MDGVGIEEESLLLSHGLCKYIPMVTMQTSLCKTKTNRLESGMQITPPSLSQCR